MPKTYKEELSQAGALLVCFSSIHTEAHGKVESH
jgi:hypothetical protein